MRSTAHSDKVGDLRDEVGFLKAKLAAKTAEVDQLRQRLLVERVKAVLRRSTGKDRANLKETDAKVLERGRAWIRSATSPPGRANRSR
jgi:hypothetical protein